MDYETLAGVAFGGITVYTFFWNQGRAKKSDEEAVNKLIHTENEKQNKELERNNEQQHKRHNQSQDDFKKIQYKDGYGDGYRDGYEKGKAEVRADVDLIKKITE